MCLDIFKVCIDIFSLKYTANLDRYFTFLVENNRSELIFVYRTNWRSILYFIYLFKDSDVPPRINKKH